MSKAKEQVEQPKTSKKIVLFILTCILISIFIIIKSFNLPGELQKDVLYSYTVDESAKYKVYLFDNNFIKDSYMEMDKSYITELVDYIDLDLNYVLNGSKLATMDYSYDIIANLYVDYASSGELKDSHLWIKEYDIVKDKKVKAERNSKIKISENVKFDYSTYNDEVKRFRESFGMPITAYLNIQFTIKANVDVDGTPNDSSGTSVVELNMPLNQQVFDITTKKSGNTQKTIYASVGEIEDINKPLFIIGTLILAVSLIGLFGNIRKYIRITGKSDYEIALSKVLKNYGDIVAEILHPIETSYMKIIDVKNFDQLLDIEEEIRMPILFCETKKDEEGQFTIIHDNIVYRYILRAKKRNRLY